MSELTIFKNGGAPSTAFAGVNLPTSRLDDGVAAAFARVSYKGSKWNVKYQGKIDPVLARMGGGVVQSPFLDVVILKAANHPSKAWYEGTYSEGDNSQPDCWSTHGLKPDVGVRKQQSPTCLTCPNNVWGSKINRDTGEATRGKACTDSKKLAIVPVGDIENKMYGGPMMLQVPPTSLKRLGPYQNMLEANGFHYAQVYTRITFDNESAYPLFVFDALAALDDVQAEQVVKMLQHPLIERILDTEMKTIEAWDEAGATMQGVPAQTASVHTLRPVNKPVTPSNPVSASGEQGTKGDGLAIPDHLKAKPGLTPAEQRIAELEAQLAAAKAPEPEPEPELTPEQKKIAELEAQLAAAKGAAPAAPKKPGRPRATTARTPAVAPTNMTSAPVEASAPTNASPADPEQLSLPGTGNGEDPIAKINQTLNKAKSLI